MRAQGYSAIDHIVQDESIIRQEGISFDELDVVVPPAALCLPDMLYFGEFITWRENNAEHSQNLAKHEAQTKELALHLHARILWSW